MSNLSEYIKSDEFLKGYFHMNKIYNFSDLKTIEPKLYKKLRALIKSVNPIFKLFVVLIPRDEEGRFWSDYADTYLSARELIPPITSKEYCDLKYGYVQIDLSTDGKLLPDPHPFRFAHLNASEKCKLLDALDKHFPKKYNWTGSNNRAIKLGGVFSPVDRKSLRDSDAYPEFEFSAESKDESVQLEAWQAMKKMEKLVNEQSPNAVISYSGGECMLFTVLDLDCELNLILEPIQQMLAELDLKKLKISFWKSEGVDTLSKTK